MPKKVKIIFYDDHRGIERKKKEESDNPMQKL